jgi:[acyl-carrier-protein] S-malonyltransferase
MFVSSGIGISRITTEVLMTASSQAAFVFPGQGSQKVGMGRDLFDIYESARQVFNEADRILGISLSKLLFEGPEEELRQTINAQPALVTASLACYRAASNDHTVKAFYLAGHSLGEYTALAIAGVLDFSTTIFLARERGRLMFEAGQKVPGAMAAILGLDENLVNEICRQTGTWLANINCPGQLVISGAKENIEAAITLAKSKGAARALPLQVSGAFHTPLMQPAADGLSSIISRLAFKEPLIPIVANTSALPLTTAAAIKDELLTQLTHTVQWQKSIEFMLYQGVSTFIEIGSGNVLTGLIKRIDKNVKTLNVSGINDLPNMAAKITAQD